MLLFTCNTPFSFIISIFIKESRGGNINFFKINLKNNFSGVMPCKVSKAASSPAAGCKGTLLAHPRPMSATHTVNGRGTKSGEQTQNIGKDAGFPSMNGRNTDDGIFISGNRIMQRTAANAKHQQQYTFMLSDAIFHKSNIAKRTAAFSLYHPATRLSINDYFR